MTGNNIRSRAGTVTPRTSQDADGCALSQVAQKLSVNVVYTEPRATGVALRAAELLAQDLSAAIHLRALICVPRQLSLAEPPISMSYLREILSKLVERFGSAASTHFLHIQVCRSRIETLLETLHPASLVVIGGRRRLWPTLESRLSNAAYAAGHSVAFVDSNERRLNMRWL